MIKMMKYLLSLSVHEVDNEKKKYRWSELKHQVQSYIDHDGKKVFQCPADCDMTFQTFQGLYYHIKSIHEGAKPHKCPICDFSFVRSGLLKKHMKSIHDKTNPNKCLLCDSSFLWKGDLR